MVDGNRKAAVCTTMTAGTAGPPADSMAGEACDLSAGRQPDRRVSSWVVGEYTTKLVGIGGMPAAGGKDCYRMREEKGVIVADSAGRRVVGDGDGGVRRGRVVGEVGDDAGQENAGAGVGGGRATVGCRCFRGRAAAAAQVLVWVLPKRKRTSLATLGRKKTTPPPTLSLF